VAQLWRYPVKSMAGEALERCDVERRVGIPGDRSWALRDERAGEIRGAKKIPALLQLTARTLAEPAGEDVPPVEIRLPDARLVTSDDPNVSAVLSKALGRAVTLCARRPAEDRDHYRRAHRIVDVEAEIRKASLLLPEEPVPEFGEFAPELLEFPNVLIETGASIRGFPEVDWCGRRLRIGSFVGRVVSPMLRCGMTIQPQADLPREPRIMRALVRETDMNLGIGVGVAEAGALRRGDPVELL
jgi:uncharacterized protein YcbX